MKKSILEKMGFFKALFNNDGEEKKLVIPQFNAAFIENQIEVYEKCIHAIELEQKKWIKDSKNWKKIADFLEPDNYFLHSEENLKIIKILVVSNIPALHSQSSFDQIRIFKNLLIRKKQKPVVEVVQMLQTQPVFNLDFFNHENKNLVTEFFSSISREQFFYTIFFCVSNEELIEIPTGDQALEMRFCTLKPKNSSQWDDETLSLIAEKFPFVSHLDLSRCCQITPGALNRWSADYDFLETLDLQDYKNFDAEETVFLCIRCFKLKKLKLKNCDKITLEGISAITKQCPDLEILNLSGHCALKKEWIEEITKNARNLKSLSFPFNDNLSIDSLLFLMERCSKLNHLDLGQYWSYKEDRLVDFKQKFPKLKITFKE